MNKLKSGFDNWLRDLAKHMQIRAAHLTRREQKIIIIVFWLLSLLIAFIILTQHINSLS